jgi:hypothetical protein
MRARSEGITGEKIQSSSPKVQDNNTTDTNTTTKNSDLYK